MRRSIGLSLMVAALAAGLGAMDFAIEQRRGPSPALLPAATARSVALGLVWSSLIVLVIVLRNPSTAAQVARLWERGRVIPFENVCLV